jgi:glucoamylase
VGLIAEQAWELPDLARSPFGSDPTLASIGFENGKPAGSASALTWSAGQFVRLMLDITAGKVLDRPRYTVRRYVRRTQQETALTVTSPADNSAVEDTVEVAGTSLAGNAIDVAVSNLDDNTSTTLHSTTAGPDGAFSLTVPLTGGTSVLNIVATSPSGATAREVRTVVFDFVPGTLLFEMNDPDGDDNGPGNYAYPTSDNFKPGAFDIQQFQVFDAGDRVIFRLRTRDLSPTFGSPLGAQLVDVYVHDPGAAQTSTAASFPQRNYTIAQAGAWSRLIEVQGFGQRYVDASGATLGTVNISGNAISRYITFSVTKASLGTPGPGWGFTVVLTGQDGFSPDQARGFQATPQEFQFGVCAAPSPDPRCNVDPATVPKAMDVLVPAGSNQADLLDYTVQTPVVLQPVTIP